MLALTDGTSLKLEPVLSSVHVIESTLYPLPPPSTLSRCGFVFGKPPCEVWTLGTSDAA